MKYTLFLLYFVSLYTFGAYLGPSSEGTTVCNNWYLLFFFRLLSVVLVELDSNPTRTTVSNVVYIRLYLLMMGLDTPETCTGWRNILRISCASSWFLFTRLCRDARSTKHKKNKHFTFKYSRPYMCILDVLNYGCGSISRTFGGLVSGCTHTHVNCKLECMRLTFMCMSILLSD